MARIMCVENERDWVDNLKSALRDYSVDYAMSLEEALQLLHDNADRPYDVALVDLNLLGHDDQQGGEVLDAIRSRHPSTKRILFTATPPRGAMGRGLFERYGVIEVIIKGQVHVPDLRRAVEEALSHDVTAESHEVQRSKSELRDRLYQKYEAARRDAEVKVTDALEYLDSAQRLHGASEQRARERLRTVLDRQQRINAINSEVHQQIDTCSTTRGIQAIADRVDRLQEEFG